MPTTLLDGETWEQANTRRFREESEIDARLMAELKTTTLCWSCCAPYPITDPCCPVCHNFNANTDPVEWLNHHGIKGD